MASMQVVVLGSGAWEGIPAPFCRCRVCDIARTNPHSKNWRTRPGFLITHGKDSFLLEASPDIRIQSAKHLLRVPKHILISHYHFDHMRGLYELHSIAKRTKHRIAVHGSRKTAEVIRTELGYLPLRMRLHEPYNPFSIGSISVTPMPVYHEYAQDEKVSPNTINNTYAFLFEAGGSRVVYLADYYRLPNKTVSLIANADILIADGTYLGTAKFRDTKRNHMHGQEITRLTSSLNAKRVLYHSVSHITRKTHDELSKSLPRGHALTFDGMIVQA